MNLYESIMKGLNEAVEYEKGTIKNVKTNIVTISELHQYTQNNIKRIRNRLNITQKAFARIMGVSPKTVEAWESGKNIPQGPAQRMLEILEKDSKVLIRCKIINQEKPTVKIIGRKTPAGKT